jgi:hypothetical protein
MLTFRTLVMFVAATIATVEGPIPSGAQSALHAQPRGLPRLWRQASRTRRRRRRDAGVRAGLLQGHPPCAAEAELRCLRPHRAGSRAIPSYRPWTRRPWAVGPCARVEVCGSLAALPAAEIRYALSRWKALTRYVNDGHLEIDNNAAERALRVVALGRMNFLFAGSDAGGERAAAIYSLLGSAKLNGLDPELYLHHVLERIADHPSRNINALLPWNVAIPKPNRS